MTEKLTCPVCDRTEIDTNICPNCETDLSTIRLLKELPQIEEKDQKKSQKLLIITLASVLIMGLLVGNVTGYFVSRNNFNNRLQVINQENNQSVGIAEKPEVIKPELNWCGGFNYRVKSGDSLYMLGLRFYGDSDGWQLIFHANPSINDPKNLQVGQVILIPNLTELCQTNQSYLQR
ncbi:LysM peptidoglycan-binding domain-containing protein [Cyanobacterium sp. DS4]|uniref:LysM peptidoglycan-binding domain-containing protein n=1 Tax=Cyanobacterium sp. DS4 TaxID=2878255 RepID=UPI002E823C79|nr:LysM peptidoglycan-binding domain-containing protein [Cyanobacterium sp. Dongsha4]WVK98923.1 LysM peptidoglycan-binding domain-containing protein [Cyanobacterium sp. Dongsha4]